MAPQQSVCALAIGGLDPGGGAGVAADLRAFAAAGVFGCAAVAVVTVQSTAGLRVARALPPREVAAQADEVLRVQRVGAVKTGALGGPDVVRAVARVMARHAGLPLVVDTVLAPTRGRGRLLGTEAVGVLVAELLPRATLVTANAHEAAALLRALGARRPQRVQTARDARTVAEILRERTDADAVLVKGGHLEDRESVDVLATEGGVVELAAPRLVLDADVHGGGCVLASLACGRLARGASVLEAVRWAKRRHHAWLARAIDVGGPQRVLG